MIRVCYLVPIIVFICFTVILCSKNKPEKIIKIHKTAEFKQ